MASSKTGSSTGQTLAATDACGTWCFTCPMAHVRRRPLLPDRALISRLMLLPLRRPSPAASSRAAEAMSGMLLAMLLELLMAALSVGEPPDGVLAGLVCAGASPCAILLPALRSSAPLCTCDANACVSLVQGSLP